LLFDKKVEHGSIVPDVKMAVGQRGEKNVSYFPGNAKAGFAQSLLCALDSAGGNVKDCDTGEATPNEIVNKCRITASDVKKLALLADTGP
jgi:hypothetical protein